MVNNFVKLLEEYKISNMNKRKIDADAQDIISIRKQTKTLNDKRIQADGTVKFDFMTSLQNIVLAKVVNILWVNQNTQRDIVNFFRTSMRPWLREAEVWLEVENNVLAKASELPLQKCITNKLISVVPLAGKSIFDWIGYHDEYILNNRVYSELSAVNFIGNIAWTARGKIDYGQTAKNILARKYSCLKDDSKYKLACTYCLEDEIAVLSLNVVNQNYLDGLDMTVNPMVYFWTAHITGDKRKLRNILRYDFDKRCIINTSINEHIIQLLMENDGCFNRTLNDIPIRYMWDKLSEKEKAKNILSLIKQLGNQEMRYSLLSSLTFGEQIDVFKELSGTILVDMLHDWLWKDSLLQTALRVLDFMDPISYLTVLNELNKEKIKNAQNENKDMYVKYKSILKTLWQEASKDLKKIILEYEDGKYCAKIVTALSWERDMDIIDMIFNELNTQRKKKLIFGYDGVRQCVDFIKNEQWRLVKLFINYNLSSERDIMQLKQRLIRDKGDDIALHFLEQKALDKMEQFMSWVFKSEADIDKFRRRFAYTKIYEDTLNSIRNNKVDFTELDNYFKWCAKGDLKVIKQFKNDVLELEYSCTVIQILIHLEKYVTLDKVLNWCLLSNQQQIAQYKCNIYKEVIGFKSFFYDILPKNNSLEALDKFVSWCFTRQQDIRKFKTWLLYFDKFDGCILEEILRDNKLEFADKLIKWCGISSKKVNAFKTAVMFSIVKKHSLYHPSLGRKSDLKSLIKWFSPSKETVNELKTKLTSLEKGPFDYYKCLSEKDCLKTFFKFLEEFIEGQNV